MRRLARRITLSLEIAWIYPRAWWLLHNRALPVALQSLRRGSAERDISHDNVVRAVHLGQNVGKLLSHLPVDSRCLIRSLVLTRMLDRRGIPGRLVIGVNPGESLAAHAWVEVGGHPVLDPGEFAQRRLAEL